MPVIVTDDVPLPPTVAPLVQAVTVSVPLGHRQRRRLGAAAAVDIAHRQPVVLKIEALLLGARAVARRRDRRHRRVVHRREVEAGRRVTAVSGPAGAGIAVVVDRQRQRRARRRRVGVIDIADRAGAIAC